MISATDWTLRFHDSMESVRTPWEAIQKANGFDSVFQDYSVVQKWYECFKDKDTPILFSIWHSGTCVAIYPMLIEKKYGIVILKTLWEVAFGMAFPVALQEQRCNVFHYFFTLLQESSFRWDFVKFCDIPTYRFDEYKLSFDFFKQFGVKYTTQINPTYCTDLTVTNESYYKEFLSRNTRKKHKTALKRISKLKYDFHFLKNEAALPYWDTFLNIENDGWKKEKGTSLLLTSSYKLFSDFLVPVLATYGQLHLYLLTVDDKAVAGVFNYLENGVFNGVKAGYLQEYNQYSPSNLLLLETIKHLQDNPGDAKLLNHYPLSYNYKDHFLHDKESFVTFVVARKGIKTSILFFLHSMRMRYQKENEQNFAKECS